MGIQRLLHSSCCFVNINTAITRQLIRTARTLETKWRQVCGEARVQGQRKMSQVMGGFWAAGYQNVTARSRLARVLKLVNHLFLQFSNFFSGRDKPRITDTDTMVCLHIILCSGSKTFVISRCIQTL